MEKKKVTIVTSHYKDFDKTGGSMLMWNCEDKSTAWKLAFYELWRLQMTWHFSYHLGVGESEGGVFVKAVCKEAYIGNLVETMEGVGFRNIKQSEGNVGLIDCLEIPDDVDMVDIGWC